MEKRELRERCTALGAALFGVADLAGARDLGTEPRDLFDGFTRAVVLGVPLPNGVVDECVDGPTPLYAHAYRVANDTLDRLGLRVSAEIEAAGHRAKPLPASQLLDREGLTGHVSYKALGRLAGLGWQGKSLLLVSPAYGPRFRLTAVLTDAPLAPDGPVRNRCGTCRACADACPAGAIRDVPTTDHYASRDEALALDRCARQCLEVFAPRPHIEKPICGVCVRACPWGRRRKTGKKVPERGERRGNHAPAR